jgi:hypothetical protein
MVSNSEARKRAEEKVADPAEIATPFSLYQTVQLITEDARKEFRTGSQSAYSWGYYEACQRIANIVNLYYRNEAGR